MKSIFKGYFIAFIFLAAIQINPVTAQQNLNIVTTAVPFLRISPDARAGGMSDLGIATAPDVNAGFWNAAKIPFNTNNTAIGLNYSSWLKDLGLNDVYLANLSFYHKLDDNQAITSNLRYFNLGNIQFTDFSGNTLSSYRPREFGIDLGYSLKLSDNFGMGVAVRYINSALASGDVNNSGVVYKAGSTVAGDVSMFYDGTDNNGRGLRWGLVFSNLGGKIGYTTDANAKDFIPANLGFGISYTALVEANSKLTFGLDVNKLLVPIAPVATGNASTDSALLADYRSMSVVSSWTKSFHDGSNQLSDMQFSLGGEFLYDNQFAVRAGYFYQDKSSGRNPYFSAGLGFKYQQVGVNFSYLIPSGSGVTRNPLSNTLRLGLTFDFDGAK
ncbi:MAG: type IX secretion system outer membrane channel protein PorV [Sphingobacteriia bacterium]|nr:type IX secretion system outer membrane channel protein PorV [Sphingobacteriia bacterium]